MKKRKLRKSEWVVILAPLLVLFSVLALQWRGRFFPVVVNVGKDYEVYNPTFSHDGKMLFLTAANKSNRVGVRNQRRIAMWDINARREVWRRDTAPGTSCIGVTNDGANLVVVTYPNPSQVTKNTVHLWDARNGADRGVLTKNIDTPFHLNRRDSFLVSESYPVRKITIPYGQTKTAPTGKRDYFEATAVSADGGLFAIAPRPVKYSNRRVEIWDINKGCRLRVLNVGVQRISSLTWSFDGAKIYSSTKAFDHGKTMRAYTVITEWDATGGRPLNSWKIRGWFDFSVIEAVSCLLLWGYSQPEMPAETKRQPSLCAIDMRSRKTLWISQSPDSTESVIGFVGGGRYFLTTKTSHETNSAQPPAVLLRDTKTGNLVRSFDGVSARVSPDGRILAVTSGTAVKLWDVSDLALK